MARQYTKHKRPRNSAWLKEKMLLVQAQEDGQVLDEEHLAFPADPGIPDDAYDSDCDDISSAKAVLMANLSSYYLDVLSEIDLENKRVNESLTAKLERYKERVKTFKQRLNVDLSSHVMNIVMHADFVPVNVLPANNKCLVKDNLKIERLEQENDHLFELLLSQDIYHICVSSLASRNDCREMQQSFIDVYNENLMLKAELAKRGQMVEKTIFYEVVLRCSRLENQIFKINEWQARLDAKDVSIANLRKHIESLKGKNVVENALPPNKAKVIAPGMFKLDLEPLVPRSNMLDSDLDSTCKIVQRIQEVLVYVNAACLSLTKPNEKLVAVTSINKNKKVRFTKPSTSSSNATKQVDSHNTQDSIKPVLPSTGMKSSTSASRSQPSGNTKKNRISQTTSSNLKNKVEDHPRSVKSNSNKKNRVIEPICSSSKSKIVESRISNNSKPNQSWGSNASDVPSTSLVNFKLSKLFSDSVTVRLQRIWAMETIRWEMLRFLGFTMWKGKSKKHSHKPKAEDSIQEKLYLLNMDLCGPMRIQSINGRKFILVIVDDYSRFTWVKFLRSKDEVPEFVIKFLKMIQVHLNATVRNNRIDNGIEFVNQTLKAYYKDVRISHQTSVACSLQQNNIVERQNRTLVEAARTMLIFSKALLFL
ncbi:retrovirus-related pol polyprotein from transposon TNT 1-94 [Tanacetum coccineum]